MSMPLKFAASFLAVLAAEPELVSQQFATQRHRLLPDQVAWTQVSGDLDNDDDLDLVGGVGWSLRIGRNNGEGRFLPESQPFPVYPSAIALGDIDGDGDLDIAIGQFFPWFSYLPGALYRNDGPLGFVDISNQWPTVSESPSEVLLVDFDADGDLDLVTANPSNASGQFGLPAPSCRVYLNNGAGVFIDATATRLSTVLQADAVAVGDLDGDGDLDFVFGSDTLRVFVQGSNGMAVETPGLVPNVIPSYSRYLDVDLFDYDLDGDLDLVGASGVGVHRFTNNGTGTFALTQTIADPFVIELRASDFDGDARVDLVAARSQWLQPLPSVMWRNTATGLVDVTATHLEGANIAPASIHVFDADNDGDSDLWGSAPVQGMLWHNDGQGHLLQLNNDEFSSPNILYADNADYDGDGDQDVAVIEAALLGNHTHLFINENIGSGLTSQRVTLVPWDADRAPQCLAWVDADLDGDMDLFVGSRNATTTPGAYDQLFHNVAGLFVDVTSTHMPVWGGTRNVVTGDINGDGILDLLGSSGIASLFVSDGVGGFTDESNMLPQPNAFAYGSAVLDFDADGDLDIVHATAGPGGPGSIRLLQNNWPAPFVDVTANHALPPLEAWSVAKIDIDRDGRDDLLIGSNYWATGGNGLVLLRSVGSTFVDETAARVPAIYATAGSISIADLDGDGWHDVIWRDSLQNNPIELRNQSGVLSPFASGAFLAHVPWHTAAADFDGDGDQDLVTTFGTLRNRLRHLQNAVPPRLGQHGELVLHAYDGDGINAQFGSLMLSPGVLPQGLTVPGVGTFWLDPTTAGFHSLHTISATGGEAIASYLVPALPALLGSSLFAQALFVHAPNPATWRLSNFVELQVRL